MSRFMVMFSAWIRQSSKENSGYDKEEAERKTTPTDHGEAEDPTDEDPTQT